MDNDKPTVAEGHSFGFDQMEEALGGLPAKPETTDGEEGTETEPDTDTEAESGGGRRAKAAQDLKKKAGQDVDDGEDGEEEEPGEEEQEEEPEEAEEEEEREEDPKGKKKLEGQKKAYRVKLGDKDVDLPPDTKLKVPVDGKLQDVSLSELASNWNGKVVWEKKFNELARDRHTFQTAKKELNDSISEVYKLATEKNDPRGMVYFIAETMGADPVKVWKDTVKSVAAALKASGVEVDDAALDAGFKDDELAYHRSSREREAKRGEQQRVVQEFQTRTKTVQDKYGISDKDLVETYDAMKASGKYKEEDITPEALGEFFFEKSAGQLAKKVVASLGDDIENKDRAVELLAETKLKFPEFTEEDLLAVAKEAFGGKPGKTAQKLSKKVRQTERGIPPTKKRTEKAVEALRWDDID